MAREFWLDAKTWNKDLVMDAIEVGFNGILTTADRIPQVRELARVKVIAADASADLVLGKDVVEVFLDQDNARDSLRSSPLNETPIIVYSDDWRVIPMENFLSRRSNVIQHVRSQKEAELSFEALERGADGILLETTSPEEVRRVAKLIDQSMTGEVAFEIAEVVEISQVGVGDRVAVDLCAILDPGQGLLVGNSSTFLFLVQNENVDNPYCDKRPFRVNAGGVHAYTRVPSGDTKYLAELQSGERVIVVDSSGGGRAALVGRCKIEKRSMLLISGRVGDREGSILVQNAETVRLTKPDGGGISVTQIQPGDELLVSMDDLSFGRHFGKRIRETILEL
jgi:3-dehydroquinate synthase II